MKEQRLNIDFDSDQLFPNSEYDNIVRMVIPGYDALHTMTQSFFQSKLSEEANLLIVGAGTGMELVTLGKSNSNWHILGVKPSISMLTIAQQKIGRHSLSDQVKLYQGYTNELPPTPLYDGATCILVMHFLPDDASKLALLQSIAQRLKSEAYFILADMFGEQDTETFEQFTSAWKIHGKLMGLNSEKIAEMLETARKGIHSISEQRVLELLQSADFENIVRFYTALWYGGWIATKN
jgi:tRNA (cmo5U34)-methyltransferase